MHCAAFISTSCCGLLAGLFVLTGCAPAAQPQPPSAAVPKGPRLIGEVAVVDEERRFVLVDLESNLYTPNPGTALWSANPSGKTARLKASPEQKRPFIAAEIIEGDPVVGDQVYR